MKQRKIYVYCLIISIMVHLSCLFVLNNHLKFFEKKTFFSGKNFKEKKMCLDRSYIAPEDILLFSIKKDDPLSGVKKNSTKNLFIPNLENNLDILIDLQTKFEKEKLPKDFLYTIKTKKVNNDGGNLSSSLETIKRPSKDLSKDFISDKRQKDYIDKLKEIYSKSNFEYFLEEKERKYVSNNYEKIENSKKIIDDPSKVEDYFHKKRENNKKYLIPIFSSLKKTENKSVLDNHFFEKLQKKPIFSFFSKIPSLKKLNTFSVGDKYVIDLEYIPRNDKKGYYFALTFIPIAKEKLDIIKQNYYFVIDKSNTIDSRRFNMARNSVISALKYLNNEDTFNIATFDNKLFMLFDKNQNKSTESLKYAKEFLRNQKLGTLFNGKHLYLPFNKMLANKTSKDEINNIILLSDGEGVQNSKIYKQLKKWSDINNSNQLLHVLSVDKDVNKDMLNLFASMNAGKFLSAHTIKGLRNQLIKLIKSINSPISRKLSLNVYSKKENEIKIYPSICNKLTLYQNQPIVLFGKTKYLDNFTVFLQGKVENGYINIKKDISFENAKISGKSLKKRWAFFKAQKNYMKYLDKNNESFIDKAEKILSSIDQQEKVLFR